ncbi:MAG: hypothetical protein CME65_15050 [Halobacteriovoraceae bacterium]|nr:hypothetical protein [Halobacteriovoraceae bacterium]|tara:strand:+ start:12719 stop:13201 length:483 start_codon:yes stop_codon:yes gene_type:complete
METYLKLFPGFRRIVHAENALRASQMLSNQEFDLVITDIQLDRSNALEFIERLRSQPRYYHQKIMVVSGCLTKEITLRLMQNNIRHILVKPFTARQLLIYAISCLGIQRKPKKLVDKILKQVRLRLSDKKDLLENAVADDDIQKMFDTANQPASKKDQEN